jgi:ribosomal protein L5
MQLKDKVTVQNLISNFNYSNIMEIPKLHKIVLHISLQKLQYKKELLVYLLLALEIITTQRAILSETRKSVISLQLREGMLVGAKVTLRGSKMLIFLEYLTNIVLPRLKFFKGIKEKTKINLKKPITKYKLKKFTTNFMVTDAFAFNELENEFLKFQNLPEIKVSIVTLTNSKLEHINLLTQYKLPIKF